VTQNSKDSSFRVIDRRMFTEEGDLRPEMKEQVQREKESPAPASGASAPAVGPAPGAKGPVGEPAVPAGASTRPTPVRSPYFELLVKSMANQAALLMSGLEDPATGQTVVDIEGAREVIDMLDVLREKTRGNLSPEEERLLTEVVGALQFNYVEINKAATTARAGKTVTPR
jgi:hypothetical protein